MRALSSELGKCAGGAGAALAIPRGLRPEWLWEAAWGNMPGPTYEKKDASMARTIVHAAGFAAEFGGNFIASLTQLRESCQQQGWGTVVVLPEAARQRPWCVALAAGGWRIQFLSNDASRARCARALADIVSEQDADLVHTHFAQYDLAARLAARIAGRRGRKVQVVWHAHSELNARGPLTPIRRVTNVIKYRFLGQQVWMIPVGLSVAQGLLAAGFPARRVRLVENGIDLARATAATQGRAQITVGLGIEEGDHLMLMFGWEPPRKGVDTALDAVAELIAESRRIVLVVVGGEELLQYVRDRFGVQPPSWLRVIPPAENVASLYQAATTFLSPSRSEGLPYSVCEAMANRIPVILSDIPSVSWAHRSPGALFFTPGDSQGLAAAMREVLAWNNDDRELRSNANEHLVKTEFDATVWADRILEVYREILGRGPSLAPTPAGLTKS